jgi:hypothetical protein
MGYNLNESSSDFMQHDGTALVNTEIQIDKGTVRNGGNVAANGPLDAIDVVTVYDPTAVGVVGGAGNAVGPVSWSTALTTSGTVGDGAGANAGSMLVTQNGHGLSAGNVLRLADAGDIYDGVYRIRSVVTANTYLVNGPFTSSVTGVSVFEGQAISSTDSTIKDVGYLVRDRYAIRGVALSVYNGGSDVEIMSTPASEYGRRHLHSRTSVRSHLVEEAIRAGFWHPFSGIFTTAPTAQNDFAAFGADNEIQLDASGFGVSGEFNYRYGVTNSLNNY